MASLEIIKKNWKSTYQLNKFQHFFATCVKGRRDAKIFKHIRFDVVWGELEVKYFFQRQSFTKYLRQTLVF